MKLIFQVLFTYYYYYYYSLLNGVATQRWATAQFKHYGPKPEDRNCVTCHAWVLQFPYLFIIFILSIFFLLQPVEENIHTYIQKK